MSQSRDGPGGADGGASAEPGGHPRETTAAGAAAENTSSGDAPTGRFGWRGWLLVAAVVVAFVGVPLVILYRPPTLPFLFAYLALPLVPAFLLAALAVWAALPRGES